MNFLLSNTFEKPEFSKGPYLICGYFGVTILFWLVKSDYYWAGLGTKRIRRFVKGVCIGVGLFLATVSLFLYILIELRG